MNKKDITFTPKPQAQQPDPDDADRWVAERKLPTDAPLEPEKAARPGAIVRMTFDLSRDLHRRFRTTCSSMDRNMTDELRQFVVDFLDRNEGKQ